MPRSRAVVLLALILCGHPSFAGPVTLVSKADPANPSGSAGGASRVTGVSSDGRYVLFLSNVSNLLSGVYDANTGEDLFLHDRVAGTITLVSHAALDPATTANGPTFSATLSADGRYVAFASRATNLISGQVDEPGTGDIDVFLWDRHRDSIVLVSHEPGFPLVATDLCSGPLGLSADGARLVFVSNASNLVTGQTDDGDYSADAFLYDRSSGSTILLSHTSTSATTTAGGVIGAVISADGNWVAFDSDANEVVAGQTGTVSYNVFLFNRALATTTLVSHAAASATTAAYGDSNLGAISADGSRIAYLSTANDLVAGQSDLNNASDVFLFDRATDSNVLVSHTSGSSTAAGNNRSLELSLSANGRFVAYSNLSSNLVVGDTNSQFDAFLYDWNTGANTLVSRSSSSPGTPSNGLSLVPQVAADGSFVVFRSDGTDLVAGQVDATLNNDLFLWTRSSGTTTLVTHAAGSPATSGLGSSGGFILSDFLISGDGAWIALTSSSESLDPAVEDLNALDDVFLYERAGDHHRLVTVRGGAVSGTAGGSIAYATGASLSHDGRHIAFTSNAPNLIPGTTDGNNASDVFLRDRLTGSTVLVSHAGSSPAVAADAVSRQPLVSADGSVVVFESNASNLVPSQDAGAARQLYVWDRNLGQTTLVTHSSASPFSPGNGGIRDLGYYDVSGDGRWIAFNDDASDLVVGQSDPNGGGDIFLYDRATGTTTLISHASSSPVETADAGSNGLSISADGRYIAFHSDATNLVPGQPGPGIFLYDRSAGTMVRVSSSYDWYPAISANGQRVVFTSSASDVVPGQMDGNFTVDVFLWDRTTGSIRLVSHVPQSATTAGNSFSSLGTISARPSAISADGSWVAFYSFASNLVTGQTVNEDAANIFLFDAVSGSVTLVSRSAVSPARTGNQGSYEPTLSADGRFIAFRSWASDLVPGQIDQNEGVDTFLFNREAGFTSLISHIPSSEATSTVQPDASFDFEAPRISADGAWVAFSSVAPDLVASDRNGAADAFLYANPLPGRDFFTVPPCRVLDTRQQAPALTSGVSRTVKVAGICGVPATARSVALNVTVLQPTGPGRLTLHPGDLAAPTTSTINFSAGITRSNSAILSLALDGTGTLSLTPFVSGSGTVDATVDVSGYFK